MSIRNILGALLAIAIIVVIFNALTSLVVLPNVVFVIMWAAVVILCIYIFARACGITIPGFKD